ncbi:hypothetical protein RLEG12_00605 (plasmid) [Rhizobium leguminosarum bv. trifolii CB782]|nr:hypothetical protein RLEG12_00605 [Rhizobium leguminosarum bv. trifolii CB782]
MCVVIHAVAGYTNLESQKRQYDLVDVARLHGFDDIEIIDQRPQALRQRNGRAPLL